MKRTDLLTKIVFLFISILVVFAGMPFSQAVDLRPFSKDSSLQEDEQSDVKYAVNPLNNTRYKLYPYLYEVLPKNIMSPFTDAEGNQYITGFTKEGKYAVINVTIEVKETQRSKFFFGDQLKVDSDDFPALAASGLHSDEELKAIRTITGKPVAQICRDGRPHLFSGAGFMATDEDIISVLRGDNQFVRKMDLTHPQMATPLFHAWNLVLVEVQLDRFSRTWDAFKYVFYNGVKVEIKAGGTKGYQNSIFDDEILGSYWMNLYRELTDVEKSFLKEKYSRLNQKEFLRMQKALTFIHTGEMEPYYIQRYGFYEGHTEWRADPIAIAWIFGMKSLEELEAAFDGQLYEALTGHHR